MIQMKGMLRENEGSQVDTALFERSQAKTRLGTTDLATEIQSNSLHQMLNMTNPLLTHHVTQGHAGPGFNQ